MKTSNDLPYLIAKTRMQAVFGITDTQAKRMALGGELSRVYPQGPTGPCFFLRDEVLGLIAKATVAPGKKAGRAPRKKIQRAD